MLNIIPILLLLQTKNIATKPLKTMAVVATAYTSSPRENGGWTKTATGKPLKGDIIAADPRVLPYGTVVHIKGVGIKTVEDCGSKIKGHRIDILMSRSQMNRWGRRKVQITILEYGKHKRSIVKK